MVRTLLLEHFGNKRMFFEYRFTHAARQCWRHQRSRASAVKLARGVAPQGSAVISCHAEMNLSCNDVTTLPKQILIASGSWIMAFQEHTITYGGK
jgi:hypothetical protein